jgi:hypothetical protein
MIHSKILIAAIIAGTATLFAATLVTVHPAVALTCSPRSGACAITTPSPGAVTKNENLLASVSTGPGGFLVAQNHKTSTEGQASTGACAFKPGVVKGGVQTCAG